MQVLLFAAPTDLAKLIPPISKACLHPYKVLEVSQQSLLLVTCLLTHILAADIALWLCSNWNCPEFCGQLFFMPTRPTSSTTCHPCFGRSAVLQTNALKASGVHVRCSISPCAACLPDCLSVHAPACLLACMTACLRTCLIPYVG